MDKGILTKRELVVLRLVSEGNTSNAVASSIGRKKKTVDWHLTQIYDKLQVSNRVQAFRAAAQLGLLDDNDPVMTGTARGVQKCSMLEL